MAPAILFSPEPQATVPGDAVACGSGLNGVIHNVLRRATQRIKSGEILNTVQQAGTQMINMNSLRSASLLVAVLLAAVPVAAQSVDDMQQKAMQFLEVTQAADGSWTSPDAVGITGLVTTSLLMSGKTAEDPPVKKGLDFIVASQQPTGGIHAAASRHQNYETCISILALTEANKDGRFDSVIRKAELFLRGLQWDEGEGLETTDGAYGGGGYDSKQRPDMSNTQFLVEALKKAGVAEDDPAMQKALVFVSRAEPGITAQQTAVCRQSE